MTLNERPARVLIVRHAEKPESGRDPHLSERGRSRAQAMARRLPVLFPWIGFLFAAAPRPTSLRPTETLEPIAQILGLSIDSRFDEKNPVALADELLQGARRYAQADVLVCWRHDGMASLAQALGARDAPDHWNENVYDRLWMIEYPGDGRPIFHDRALALMPEDATP